MKRQRIYLLLFPALLLVSGCSDSEQSEPEQVPIELHAQGNATVETKADQTITEAFGTTVAAVITPVSLLRLMQKNGR